MINKLLLLVIIGYSIFSSCQKKDDLERLGSLDFSRPASIGGTFLSGYQDGALTFEGQEKSIPALFYKQLKDYETFSFTLPLIENERVNGIGLNIGNTTFPFRKKSRLLFVTNEEGEGSLSPVFVNYEGTSHPDLEKLNTSFSGQYQCIPFASTQNLLDTKFGTSYSDGNPNPFYHRFSSSTKELSPLEELIAYNPSFSLCWIGMDDVYNYAINGGDTFKLPTTGEFKERAEEIIGQIVSNNSKGVLINIPDIDDLPYFNLITYNVPDLDSSSVATLNGLYELNGFDHIRFEPGNNPFVISEEGYPGNIRQMVHGEKVLFSLPINLVQENLLGIQNPMPAKYVLTLSELSKIREAIQNFNTTLQELANQYNLAFFDANSYFKDVKSGIKWNAADFSLTFASGGFISLDGYTPTQKGSELLTNEIIKAVNQKYGSAIPNVNCRDCNGVLFP
jgi:hypothetical protein